MAKTKVFSELSDGDLLASLSESKEEVFNLRFQLVTGQLDNYTRLNVVKKDVARARTELRAREIAAADALAESTDPALEDSDG